MSVTSRVASQKRSPRNNVGVNLCGTGYYAAFAAATNDAEEGAFNLVTHDCAVDQERLQLLRLPGDAHHQQPFASTQLNLLQK